VWLQFKGGKGVATAFGVLLGTWPALTVAGVGALLVWIVTVKLSRLVGLASVAAAASLPILVVVIAQLRGQSVAHILPYLIVAGAMAALVIFRHRGNLIRICKGTEPKIGS
jgi:glycerol-3-phosphate acyltransferase PlsY